MAEWWRRKIRGNQARDRLVNRTLRKAGWRVVRIWEHELTRLKAEGRMLKGKPSRLVRRIRAAGI